MRTVSGSIDGYSVSSEIKTSGLVHELGYRNFQYADRNVELEKH
jgi:hypothetical protein